MKCIAIDDEPIALSILSQYCRRLGNIELSVYTDPLTGIRQVKRTCPDLLFLDIEMGEYNGITLADELPKGTFLLLTTTYAQYAIDGFDLDAIDFLHKPFSCNRFHRAIQKAEHLQALQNRSVSPALTDEEITVKAAYKNVKIRLADILYIEAMDNYVRIHRPDLPPVLSQMSMKHLQTMLPDCFLRVHKSFIVPLHRIAGYTRSQLTLYYKNIALPVGRAYSGLLFGKMETR